MMPQLSKDLFLADSSVARGGLVAWIRRVPRGVPRAIILGLWALALTLSGLTSDNAWAVEPQVYRSTLPTASEMQIEALTSAEDDRADRFVWFAGLTGVLIAIGLWTALSGSLGGHRADNLFLNLRLQVGRPGENSADRAKSTPHSEVEEQVYLRALDLRHATFVSSKALTRGQPVRLNLSSLPQYPDAEPNPVWIDAEVKSAHLMRGDESYLITVHIPPLETGLKDRLLRYLDALAAGARLSHA